MVRSVTRVLESASNKKGVQYAVKETMQHLNLYELIGALSFALDMTEGNSGPPSLRRAWIGMAIGRNLKLDSQAQHDLYCVLMLSSMGELEASDSPCVPQTVADVPLPPSTYSILSQAHVAPDVAHHFEPAGRNFLHSGAQTLRQLQFSEDVIASIYGHEHSISLNDAVNDRSETRRMFVNIARLAKDIDGVYTRSGQEAVQSYINAWCKRSVFDPTFISSVARAVQDDDVWHVLHSDELALHLRDVAPEFQTIPVDDDYLDYIAAAFGCIMDKKSADTSGHSRRVALYVDLIADRLGFEQSRRRCLHRGAFLHDIGKLGISNALLNKPGKLSSAEWVVMRKHAGYTEEIIASMEPFIELARIAGAHHERLDGKGYPRGLTALDIPLESRIITVADIFDAISADRAYRSAIPIPEALAMMGRLVGTALDPRCMDALRCIIEHGKAFAASSRGRVSSFKPLMERWT